MKALSDKAIERLRREASMPDLTGTKYKLVEKIGSGGMGEVYLVEDTELSRKAALKVIGSPCFSEALSTRLLREAKIVAQLEHPGIVPVHDVGKLSDGRTFFTMKYVQGENLGQYLKEQSGLPNLLRVFQKICEAVAFAHSRGVIHRDLKPENVMVGEFGEVLVMDWGIAKIIDEIENRDQLQNEVATTQLATPEKQNLTAEGTVMGTPYYMSPEQAQGHTDQVDQRTDVYALGAILYFLLTGEHPVKGSTHDSVVDSTTSTKEMTDSASEEAVVLHPRKLDGKIARSLDAICVKSMSTQRDDRYANANEIGGDITRFLDGQPVSAYRENVFEVAGRWIGNNRFVFFLVLTYIVMRFFLFLLVRR